MIRSRPTVHVIALLVGMAVLFNIERLDFIEENLIDIRTFVYIIGSLAVILIVASGWVLRWPLFLKVGVCLSIYTAVKLLDGRPEPWWGGKHTWITVAEVSLLALLVGLAHQLALGLRELEKSYGRTRLADVRRREKSEWAAAEQVQMAVALARRHKLPLSVVAIEIADLGAAEKTAAEGGKTPEHARPDIAPLLDSVLRTTDLLLEQPRRGHFVVVCQMTDADGARQLARRIHDLLAARTGRRVLTGVATFPTDAQRFQDLVHDAEERLHAGPPAHREEFPHAYRPVDEFDAMMPRDRRAEDRVRPSNAGQDDASARTATLSTAAVDVALATELRPTATSVPVASPTATDASTPLRELDVAWLARIDPQRRILRGHKYALAKWMLDCTLVLVTMPLWLPILALCALAVKLESPRDPVFFRQERTGRGGRRFRMLKLRTMVVDAEQAKVVHAYLNAMKAPDFKIVDDPRVTRVGRVLRKTSLDELPQLFNVLGGQMSLVGPRPTSFATENYAVWQTERLDVMPGITGLWQLLGRGVVPWDDRTRFDIAYIEKRCLWLDIQILLRTIPAVLRRRGAY